MDLLAVGLSLGLGAGLAPGPLLALVVRSTLQHGRAAGVRAAFGPLVTDLPIIVLALSLAVSLPASVLGVLGVVGGGFVVWLGVEALRETPDPVAASTQVPVPRRDLLQAALVNALSPHPWLFWITVGAPILGQAGAGDGALFLGGFYLLLIGTKAAIAVALGSHRDRLLEGRGYALALRGSAILLIGTGAVLALEGLRAVA